MSKKNKKVKFKSDSDSMRFEGLTLKISIRFDYTRH